MVALDVPKVRSDRTVQWVRVVIAGGHVSCEDDDIRRKVEALKPIYGLSGADPDSDYSRAQDCRRFLAARIVEYAPQGNGQPPPDGVVM
jgi:hypothetical protein